MRYLLMHKNISVLLIEIDDTTGIIIKIISQQDINHLPCGVKINKGKVDRATLNDWWVDRSIPASRSGIAKALEVLNMSTTKMLLLRCFGLSLSDQYWIKPESSELKWEQINFFDNDFSEDIGNVLLGKLDNSKKFDFKSPDNTSDGCLKKRWKIINGKRCLIKSGSTPFMQQPFNEVIASIIAKRLGVPHVDYTIEWDGDIPYSKCEDFITKDTELVSAWRVMQSKQKDNSTSVYMHYVNCCNELGIKDIVHSIDQMIVLDYIIANEDRHQNNFGLIRDANTLEWIGVAPIFDSGSSLGYDKLVNQILNNKGIECKPFKKSHELQVKLVSDFSWIDFSKLEGVEDEITTILDEAKNFIDEAREKAIIESVLKRIESLKGFKTDKKATVGTEGDVEVNIAETYLRK